MWLKSLLGICIKADDAGIGTPESSISLRYLNITLEDWDAASKNLKKQTRKTQFFFLNSSFNYRLSCSDQEPVCGQRDGEEYGGGGAGLQAGHPVILPSHWLRLFSSSNGRSVIIGRAGGLENLGKSTEVYGVLEP